MSSIEIIWFLCIQFLTNLSVLNQDSEPFSFLSQHLYSLLFCKVLCAWVADRHLLNVFWCILCLKFKQQWQQTPPKWWKCDKDKCWASLVAQKVKNPPAMQETWVWSLGWEDPLEKVKDTHSRGCKVRPHWKTFTSLHLVISNFLITCVIMIWGWIYCWLFFYPWWLNSSEVTNWNQWPLWKPNAGMATPGHLGWADLSSVLF